METTEAAPAVQHGKEPEVSYPSLVLVWAALVAATALTVCVSHLHLDKCRTLLPVAIAAGKCALVLIFFMRLRHEPRFFTLMCLIAVATLAAFIGLLLFDVSFR
jgi:cytochrome c oxidase subunit 4